MMLMSLSSTRPSNLAFQPLANSNFNKNVGKFLSHPHNFFHWMTVKGQFQQDNLSISRVVTSHQKLSHESSRVSTSSSHKSSRVTSGADQVESSQVSDSTRVKSSRQLTSSQVESKTFMQSSRKLTLSRFIFIYGLYLYAKLLTLSMLIF